jgi:signal transduction histidine kinase
MKMNILHRLHLPRRTVRFRLTVLYGGLFLLAGAALLAVTYFLVSHSTGNSLYLNSGGKSVFIEQKVGGSHFYKPKPLIPTTVSLAEAQSQIHKLLAQATRQHDDELHQLLITSGVALAIMAVVSIGLGWLVAGRALQPLRTITTAVRDISAGNLHERLALDGPDDELRDLGDTFDALLGRLESSFEAQRRFVANASHELRTPLARQRTLVEVAMSDPEATIESLRASYQRVLTANEDQERLIEALLTLARSERGIERRERFDLATLTGDVLLTRHPEARRRGLRIVATLSSAPTSGDPRLVERLVTNLVDNAVRHNVTQGQVEVMTGTRSGQAVLSVVNSGPVIPSAELDRLFQPFQRLGAERIGHRDGLGLGLSIVQAIAVAHGATLTTGARPEGGLSIDVRFPAIGGGADEPGFSALRDIPEAVPQSTIDRVISTPIAQNR